MYLLYVGSMQEKPQPFLTAEALFAEYDKLIVQAPARPLYWEKED